MSGVNYGFGSKKMSADMDPDRYKMSTPVREVDSQANLTKGTFFDVYRPANS